jgi:hypothetical protein
MCEIGGGGEVVGARRVPLEDDKMRMRSTRAQKARARILAAAAACSARILKACTANTGWGEHRGRLG